MITTQDLVPIVGILNALEPRLCWRVLEGYRELPGPHVSVTGVGFPLNHVVSFGPQVKTLDDAYPHLARMWSDAQAYLRYPRN